jgi:hypothetical protein
MSTNNGPRDYQEKYTLLMKKLDKIITYGEREIASNRHDHKSFSSILYELRNLHNDFSALNTLPRRKRSDM